MITLQQLKTWRDTKAEIERTHGAKMFLNKPANWLDDPHWFCQNGHVSGNYLNDDGDDICFECMKPVILGPRIGEAAFALEIAKILKDDYERH